MTEALTIAVSGLRAAIARVANAASNLVNVSSTQRKPDGTETPYQPTDVITLSDSVGNNNLGVRTEVVPRKNNAGVDIASEIIDTKIAEIAYKANAAVIRTQSKMDKELDRLA
jgi:flagellar basal body rod protein FlgC